MGNKNNWDADAMKGTLISDMEREVREGISKGTTDVQDEKTSALRHQPSAIIRQPSAIGAGAHQGWYRRLNDIKLTRRENIAALVAQAIELWLDVQEGKRKVSE